MLSMDFVEGAESSLGVLASLRRLFCWWRQSLPPLRNDPTEGGLLGELAYASGKTIYVYERR